MRDIIDSQTPMLARLVLANFLPEAYLAMLLERYVLNPVLAAPAHMYEAARRELLALQAVARGDGQDAIDQDKAAATHLREAALAILAVVPFGEAAAPGAAAAERLAASGVEYMGTRPLFRGIAGVRETPSLIHQFWVTGQEFESVFRLPSGAKVYVDGFINRTGLDIVDRVGNMVLVEVKMESRVSQVLNGVSHFDHAAATAMHRQFERYVELGQRLGVGGVRYVITEATPGSPVTNAFRSSLNELRPELIESGFLEVFSTPPPPPSFGPPRMGL